MQAIGEISQPPAAMTGEPGPAETARIGRSMKIFFSGGLAGPWTSSWQRCECLRRLGHDVVAFDQDSYISRAVSRSPMRFLGSGFYDEHAVDLFNREILAAIIAARPDVAWLEWPMLVRADTLREAGSRLPGCRWVSFQDDNPFGSRRNEQRRWRHFLEAIPQFDMHLVKRESDVTEFRARGARQIQRFRHGFYAPLFRPIANSAVPGEFRQDVSFVGTPLDHRVAAISDLLIRHRLAVRIYGGRWNRTLVYHRRRSSFRPPVLAQDYARVICGSRISLGFVSSSNRDEYTMRTFEIPACKGFLLAERTPSHQQLFCEGKEAEFFSSTEECADKIRFYLHDEPARARIAEAGYRRCIDSDYSLQRSVAEAMSHIQSLVR